MNRIQPFLYSDPATINRYALGIIFFHFGLLKFFPDLSPAELIAEQMVFRLLASLIDLNSARIFIACFEVLIGLMLLLNWKLKWCAPLFAIHMLGTLATLFLLPEYAFKIVPFAPTFEGQYILKNLVLLSSGWVVFRPHLLKLKSNQ